MRVSVVFLSVVVTFVLAKTLPHGLPPPVAVSTPIPGTVPAGARALSAAIGRGGKMHLFTVADGKLAYKEEYRAYSPRFTPWKELFSGLNNYNSASPDETPVRAALGQFKDGRMIVFVTNAKDHLEVRWETVEEPCRWSRRHGIPGRLISSPVTLSTDDYGVEVFAISTLGKVVHTWVSDTDELTWFKWKTLNSPRLRPDSLSLVHNNGEVYLFGVEAGPLGRIVTASRSTLNPKGKWSSWDTIETPVQASYAPEAIADDLEGTIAVFFRGEDGHLYETERRAWEARAPEAAGEFFESPLPKGENPWTHVERFEDLAETFKFPPSAATSGDGRITLTALDDHGAIWLRWQVRRPVIEDLHLSNMNDPSILHWSEWHSMGGNFKSRPIITVLPNSLLDIFAVSNAPHAPLFHSRQTELYSGFPAFLNVLGPKETPLKGTLPGNIEISKNDIEEDHTVLVFGKNKISQLIQENSNHIISNNNE